ncbi:MAG: nucleotidyltransferase domain-containing protein [Candidatus Pacearchaeota archaeon]
MTNFSKGPKDLNQEINDTTKYIPKDSMPEISEEVKKEMEARKKELDNIQKQIIKKYPFTLAIGILPPQSIPGIEKEEPIPESEKNEKRTHILHLIPEEQFKNIPKIKKEILEITKHIKPKLWFHIITPVDIWNFLMDARYDLTTAISMAFPLYDKGLLGALRVAEVHKNLVLQKFERYVGSYVIAGSLVRGTATKTSDIDVAIIIDDTDVKRMPRIELKEKLRGIIYQYIAEANAIAGVKNKLEPQVWLMTEFWESVKDANPVMFTFIRDGVALFDKGMFTPWKLLLQMGKIKPSPEAIDTFMAMGDKTKSMVERRLIDAMIDVYYGVLTPSQALLMLYGLPPPTHKETPAVFKDIFYTKEKLIEAKYVKTLEKAVLLFKDYEHGKLKTISGKEIDELLKEFEDFSKRVKKLREEIESVSREKTIEEISKEVFELLLNLFGKKSKTQLIENFNKELVKKGKIAPKFSHTLKNLEEISKKIKKGKTKTSEVEKIRKETTMLINNLIDYGQRCDLIAIEKGRMQIVSHKGDRAELLITSSGTFIIQGNVVKKITSKIEESSIEELNKAIGEQKGKLQTKISPKVFEILRKELGEFEIVL